MNYMVKLTKSGKVVSHETVQLHDSGALLTYGENGKLDIIYASGEWSWVKQK